MIKIYVKDPIPPPKEGKEDIVTNRISSGNVAWDLAMNFIKITPVNVQMISKMETVVVLEEMQYDNLKKVIPEKIKNWIFMEETIN